MNPRWEEVHLPNLSQINSNVDELLYSGRLLWKYTTIGHFQVFTEFEYINPTIVNKKFHARWSFDIGVPRSILGASCETLLSDQVIQEMLENISFRTKIFLQEYLRYRERYQWNLISELSEFSELVKLAESPSEGSEIPNILKNFLPSLNFNQWQDLVVEADRLIEKGVIK